MMQLFACFLFDFESSSNLNNIEELFQMPEIEGLVNQVKQNSTQINEIKNITKTGEILQQELVQVRQESIVSYKMLQNLQKQV